MYATLECDGAEGGIPKEGAAEEGEAAPEGGAKEDEGKDGKDESVAATEVDEDSTMHEASGDDDEDEEEGDDLLQRMMDG